MYYFAYGSNMSMRRLQARIEVTKTGTGKLPGYQLRFHKVSRIDGTGKCDAFLTGDPADQILGVLYTVSPEDQQALNRLEGEGFGYEVKRVRIATDGRWVDAITYVAEDIDAGLKPFDWYKEHVLRGARENGLPKPYIEMIRNVPAIPDTDWHRKQKETAIYEQ